MVFKGGTIGDYFDRKEYIIRVYMKGYPFRGFKSLILCIIVSFVPLKTSLF